MVFLLMAPTHRCAASNAVYDALVGRGVQLSPHDTLQLPKPALPDGMYAQQQRQTIEALIAGRYDWDTFARESVVSPFLLKISDKTAETGPVVRKVDLYFVAYGSLNTIGGEDYLQKQLNLAATNNHSDDGGRTKVLSSDELRKRGIATGRNPDDPRWIAVASTLLGKVRISLTTENVKTTTSDSVIIASIADPRFANDAEYPNSWRSLSFDDAGQRQLGPLQHYVGLGSYVKATRLAEPAGAIFIEYHVAFVEPQGWFHGTNLLRSKLPIVAQEMVRKFRRSLGQ
ncbi:MAG TPA: hypothetical protein VHE81_07610 [Lacipirellulaceae bacterium]|nr:hypothetical protein [Lacipirellulaceae bacterium]